jgi:general secretion pathway protein I
VVTGTEVPGLGRIDVRVFTDEGQVADRVLFRAAAA